MSLLMSSDNLVDGDDTQAFHRIAFTHTLPSFVHPPQNMQQINFYNTFVAFHTLSCTFLSFHTLSRTFSAFHTLFSLYMLHII